jgi:cation diffusion facilitator family transporter
MRNKDPSMRSEQDIRHAISLRPSPFHTPHSGYAPSHGHGSDSPHRISEIHRAETSSAHLQHFQISSGASTPISLDHRVLAAASADVGVPGSVGVALGPHVTTNGGEDEGRSTAYEAAGSFEDAVSRHVNNNTANLDADDLESQRRSAELERYSPTHDPYQLSSKLKSDEEINQIKANTSKKRAETDPLRGKKGGALAFCTPFVGSGEAAYRGRKIQHFYQSQNENIQMFLKPVDDHRQEAKATYGENQARYKIAVHGSFIANVCLAVLQMYAAIASGSLSLFTTMADALFDPLSNVTLILSNRAVNRVDARKFPSGKARIETAGNIVFCFIMTAVSLVIIVQSIRDLAEGSTTPTSAFHLPSIIVVGLAFTTKLCLFLYCYSLRNLYSQIHILWEDHRNDLIINGTGLMFSLLGSKVRWWIDPMGAILISCLIIFLWLRTAYSEFHLLIGVSADTATLQLITYISATHSHYIKAIDTVRAYYSGPRLIVEVDIVMDANDTLKHTHDVAEELQFKLESLPNVERAYVHVDYETSHAPEHFLKKEL